MRSVVTMTSRLPWRSSTARALAQSSVFTVAAGVVRREKEQDQSESKERCHGVTGWTEIARQVGFGSETLVNRLVAMARAITPPRETVKRNAPGVIAQVSNRGAAA
jgi:hypothetical protein